MKEVKEVLRLGNFGFQFLEWQKKIEKSHFQLLRLFSTFKCSPPPFSLLRVLLCSCQSSEHVVTTRKALLDALLTTQTVVAFNNSSSSNPFQPFRPSSSSYGRCFPEDFLCGFPRCRPVDFSARPISEAQCGVGGFYSIGNVFPGKYGRPCQKWSWKANKIKALSQSVKRREPHLGHSRQLPTFILL